MLSGAYRLGIRIFSKQYTQIFNPRTQIYYQLAFENVGALALTFWLL
jgi:hypothetical protein